MRWGFLAFFLALAIPATLLSLKAHQQIRWQIIHQYQKEAERLVTRIDAQIGDAIRKEELRSDTEYTFFVLAGTPESRFIQRSELSKFPVESPLGGIIGYFQIDEDGSFSTPILPSAHVQSEVQPHLYGISQAENQKRKMLENQVQQILFDNRLVDVSELRPTADSQQTIVAVNEESKLEESVTLEKSVNRASTLNDELQSGETLVMTGSRITRDDVKPQEKTQSKVAEKKAANPKSRQPSSYFSEQLKSKQTKRYTQSADENDELTQRRSRKESNYSPQQSLYEQESSRPVERDKIEIKLFESEIEPFRFERLESGHFVAYRQVWQNSTRLIQGAVFSAEDFVNDAVLSSFKASSLFPVARMYVRYGQQTVSSFGKSADSFSSKARLEELETIASMKLSAPFNQLAVEFRLAETPSGSATGFVNLVTVSLLLVLTLGIWLLYRLAIKQADLVEQQQDFVSSVSHELKTPLTSIRMYGEILREGWVNEAKRKEYYDYIYTESERLSRLISNVLQISKVNHNALDLDLIPVSVAELANMMRSKLDSQVAQSEFSMNISVAPELQDTLIKVDSDAMLQIMINLVDNSIKYASKAELKRINIDFQMSRRKEVIISIRDYGPGIVKDQLNKIFDLFYRCGSEMTREVQGTGIGLALVRELVTAMKAKIEAINHQPGVEFKIRFSVYDQR